MGRYVKMLLLLLAFLLGGTTNGFADNDKEKGRITSVEYITDTGKATGTVIVDAQNLVRICNSRPQRILTSYLSKPERTGSRISPSIHTNQLQNHLTEWVSKDDTAPFLPAAPSDYFVFTLRRLLC